MPRPAAPRPAADAAPGGPALRLSARAIARLQRRQTRRPRRQDDGVGPRPVRQGHRRAGRLHGRARRLAALEVLRLEVAGVEPGKVLRQLGGHELLHFLAELLAQLPEELRRRNEVQPVVAVRGARAFEVVADALREELGSVLGGAGFLAVRSGPAAGMAAEARMRIRDELA